MSPVCTFRQIKPFRSSFEKKQVQTSFKKRLSSLYLRLKQPFFPAFQTSYYKNGMELWIKWIKMWDSPREMP